MAEIKRWRDTGNLERAVETAREVLSRYIDAMGGTLRLIADFGDEQLKVA